MNTLLNTDSISTWGEKINDGLYDHSIIKSFWLDLENSYTPGILDFSVLGGILRDGVTIYDVPSAVVTTIFNSVNYICINTITRTLVNYTSGSIPATSIPLYKITVDGSYVVTEIKDVRTAYKV